MHEKVELRLCCVVYTFSIATVVFGVRSYGFCAFLTLVDERLEQYFIVVGGGQSCTKKQTSHNHEK